MGGLEWNLHDGVREDRDMRVYSFVAVSEIRSFHSNLKPFFDHLIENEGFPGDTQHLISKSMVAAQTDPCAD